MNSEDNPTSSKYRLSPTTFWEKTEHFRHTSVTGGTLCRQADTFLIARLGNVVNR